jgi:hypothetical protein
MAGSDEVTPVAALQHPDDVRRSHVRSRHSPTVVFCDENVTAGFALALALMEADETFLIMSPRPDMEGD